jgi:hypothetical protein
VHPLLSFPNPVNEKAARTVASGVLVLCALALVPGLHWLCLPIAAGFLLRVAAGPRFSPLGQLATRVIAPRLGPARLVAGPPKRFAQAIGAVLSTGSVIVYLGTGSMLLAGTLLVLIMIAAALEAALGLCLGCVLFRWLMRAGLIAEGICLECNAVGLRYGENG